ncbi:MAG: hypothetical protein WC054_08970 [Candidatus Nanopelagicales bacterium]
MNEAGASEEKEVGGHWSFSAHGAVFAFGRFWLHDHSCRSLVCVDLDTGIPQILFELDSEPGESPEGYADVLPPQLLASQDYIWVICPPEQVRRVDPVSGEVTLIPTDGVRRWCASNADAIFGLSNHGLHRLSQATLTQTSVRMDGYVQVITASEDFVWLVDRTRESVLCVDAVSLEVLSRTLLNGGEVHQLFPQDNDVIAIHNRDLEAGIMMSARGIENRSAVLRIRADGSMAQLGEIGIERTLEVCNDSLWIGDEFDSPDSIDEWPDPVGVISRLDLATGFLERRVFTVPGQVDEIHQIGDQLWICGFRRTLQRHVVTVISLDSRESTEVDLRSLSLRYDNSQEPPQKPTRPLDEVLGSLAAEIRTALTRSDRAQDPRTGQWHDAGSSINRRFTLREVVVKSEPISVAVLFTWADESGTTFGFEFDEDFFDVDHGYGEGIENAADNVWLYVMEESDTGIMKWGRRTVQDGITWIS